MICVATPEPFLGVGQFYDDFTQVPDDQVVALLDVVTATPTTPAAVDPSDDPPADPATRTSSCGTIRCASSVT